jgi:hypothetical protein
MAVGRKSNQTLRREFISYCRRERGLAPQTLYPYDNGLRRMCEHPGAHPCLGGHHARSEGLVLALTLKGKNGAGAEPPEDNKHQNSALGLKKGLGTLGARWAFVDDMVSTGTTLTRVYGEIQRVCAHMQHHTEFVGVYQYIDKATGRAPTAGTTCSSGGASRAA